MHFVRQFGLQSYFLLPSYRDLIPSSVNNFFGKSCTAMAVVIIAVLMPLGTLCWVCSCVLTHFLGTYMYTHSRPLGSRDSGGLDESPPSWAKSGDRVQGMPAVYTPGIGNERT